MTTWLLAVVAGLVAAVVQYGRAAVTPRILPLALLRALAATLVVALLLSAPAGRATTEAADVALDASQSWTRASDSTACTTVDSAHVTASIGPSYDPTARAASCQLVAGVTRRAPGSRASRRAWSRTSRAAYAW